MDDTDLKALQAILDKYDPLGQPADAISSNTSPAAHQIVPIQDTAPADKADEIAIAFTDTLPKPKADEIAIAFTDMPKPKADEIATAFTDMMPKPKKRKRRLQPRSSTASSPSSAKPTPPSRRSSMLFAAMLSDTVVTHIWLVFSQKTIIRNSFGKYIYKK